MFLLKKFSITIKIKKIFLLICPLHYLHKQLLKTDLPGESVVLVVLLLTPISVIYKYNSFSSTKDKAFFVFPVTD